MLFAILLLTDGFPHQDASFVAAIAARQRELLHARVTLRSPIESVVDLHQDEQPCIQ
jgi:hypothetical protein